MSNENVASLAQRLNGKLHRLFELLVLAFVVIGSFQPVMNNVDIGWHVAQGRWMVEHGAIYRQDLLNYPNLGHAIIDEYPLFQVILYLAWSLGWWGPCLLTGMAYAALFGILLKAAKSLDMPTSALLAMAIGLLPLFLQVATPLRPHLATYLGVVILGIFLLRHRGATSWTTFWPMALLQVAWTNSHSGFVLGPALVGLFGAEMIVRQGIKTKSLPWATMRTWTGAFLLILLACFINPYGIARFYPPFYQDRLESIRAYVGEMEPLTGGAAILYGCLAAIALALVAMTMFIRRGAVSFSFLLLASLFYLEALSAKKAWPIFGLFVPLLVLGSGAFSPSSRPARKPAGWLGILGHLAVLVPLAIAIMVRLDGSSDASLKVLWREYDHGHSELSIDATDWMKAHGVKGRLFHRCEDGGILQQEGYDNGETFGDTGFGKYEEDFIHENGLVEERPRLLPRYLLAYQPDYVVCGTFCYQWPHYLKLNGWRLIFYSPNSSVWTRSDVRTDLPTLSDEDVVAIFDHDTVAYGRPVDFRLFGRNLIALNSMGLEDFALARLKALPETMHHAPWYWEAARILCFQEPAFLSVHRTELLREAEELHDDGVTAEFRAWCSQAAGDTDGALRILENIPRNRLGNYGAELLLRIYLDRKRPEALALARRSDCFDLRNGRYWSYLAEAEEQAGHPEAATRAWKKAVFYYPDDEAVMDGAATFAEKFQDVSLSQAMIESAKIYGKK